MNNEFIWTDDLVAEFCNYFRNLPITDVLKENQFKKFKALKQASLPVKDFEIVSLRYKLNGNVWVKVNEDRYELPGTQWWLPAHSIYNCGDYEIHSVRRISDNCLFSVGEKFTVTPGYNIHEIKSFRIDGNALAVIAEDFPQYTYYLPHLQKSKEPVKPLSDEIIERPPLGIMPEWLWKEQRYHDILAADERYRQAGMQIPYEWFKEAMELTMYLLERKKQKQ